MRRCVRYQAPHAVDPRAWVYVSYVWRRGGISCHQPMNWHDSIRASDNHHTWWVFPLRQLHSVSFPTQRTWVTWVTETLFIVNDFLIFILFYFGEFMPTLNETGSWIYIGKKQTVRSLPPLLRILPLKCYICWQKSWFFLCFYFMFALISGQDLQTRLFQLWWWNQLMSDCELEVWRWQWL